MIILFISTLFLTFFIVRILTHLLHDQKNYGTPFDKSKTFTHFLRKYTKIDWHHIHIGFIILFITLLFGILKGLSNITIIFIAISSSLILDQIAPLFGFGNYFSRKMIKVSLILHIILSVIVIIFSSN